MIGVAIKMLLGDRLKYYGLITGIGFAAMLIVQQASILVGLAHQCGSFIRDTSQADLWVMDDQVRFSQDSLPISDNTLLRTRGIEGVEWAVPLYQGFLKAKLPDGTRMITIVVGLDDATLMGGPPEMVRGTLADLRRDRGIFIDADAAHKFMMKRGGGRSVAVGDRMSINDHEVEVVGSYRASKSFFWEPVVYTTYSRAMSLAPGERRMLNYVLVKARPGVDVAALQARIQDATGLAALTGEQFMKRTGDYILYETGIIVNFGLAVLLGFIVGTLVAGQMLYNFTIDNLRFYGTLKAMGATDARLVGMVLVQCLIVALLGFGIGAGTGAVLGKLVGDAGLAFRMPWAILGGTLAAIVVCCLLAGLVSIARVLRLEPGVVFKA